MTKKIQPILPRTSTRAPKMKSDEEFSFSEDALNLAVKRLPPGYSRISAEMPDAQLSSAEKRKLLKKSLPKILGENTEMAWVFTFMVFEGESLKGAAVRLKAITRRKYSLTTIKELYIRALVKVAVLLDETEKTVRDEERMEKSKSRHGQIH